MKHKWCNEIIAWANGAKIEVKHIADNEWEIFEGDWSLTEGYEFRIKTQLKEPQYLYVYLADEGYHLSRLNPKESKYMEREQVVCIGKIKLEEDKETI
jgi:hypothetical protein